MRSASSQLAPNKTAASLTGTGGPPGERHFANPACRPVPDPSAVRREERVDGPFGADNRRGLSAVERSHVQRSPLAADGREHQRLAVGRDGHGDAVGSSVDSTDLIRRRHTPEKPRHVRNRRRATRRSEPRGGCSYQDGHTKRRRAQQPLTPLDRWPRVETIWSRQHLVDLETRNGDLLKALVPILFEAVRKQPMYGRRSPGRQNAEVGLDVQNPCER